MDFKKQIKEYYAELVDTIDKLDIDELNEVMNVILRHYKKGSNIYVFGNGGSSATASHMMVDFNKGACMNVDEKFHMICLNDNVPTLMAVANDMSFDDVFSYQLENRLTKDDLVIAISGSGNSKNIVKAAMFAKQAGAEIIGITGYKGGKLYELSSYHMHAPIENMQVVEDVHMSFDHMMMYIFCHFLTK